MTTTAYDRLTDVLDEAIDEGSKARKAAFQVLEALREPDPMVLQAGVEPGLWTAAIDALPKVAAEVDAAELAPILAEREAFWPAFRRDLEALGCRLRTRAPTVMGGKLRDLVRGLNSIWQRAT
jgi:hypothetical protein